MIYRYSLKNLKIFTDSYIIAEKRIRRNVFTTNPFRISVHFLNIYAKNFYVSDFYDMPVLLLNLLNISSYIISDITIVYTLYFVSYFIIYFKKYAIL